MKCYRVTYKDINEELGIYEAGCELDAVRAAKMCQWGEYDDPDLNEWDVEIVDQPVEIVAMYELEDGQHCQDSFGIEYRAHGNCWEPV